MSQIASFNIKDVYLGTNGTNKIADVETPYAFISSILPNIYIISGILLLIYAVFGGFMMVTSAGNPDGAKQGQQILTNAIIGFIVIFASYWIIQIIEVITGIKILSFA